MLFSNRRSDRQADAEAALFFLVAGGIRPVKPVKQLIALLTGQGRLNRIDRYAKRIPARPQPSG